MPSPYRFDEFAVQTIDFTDAATAAAYDAKQATDIEAERGLAERLALEPHHTVLEFGPGTGALSLAMAERCAHVYAVDTSAAMLEVIARRGRANVSTHHAGFLSYAHEGAPVDLIVSKFSFHHLPDFWKGVALTRMNRVLAPGGRLYLHDVIFSFSPEQYEGALDAWIEKVTTASSWNRHEFEVHVNEEYSTYAWILEGLVQRAGFEILSADYPSPTYGAIMARKVLE
jgi:putative AdoMet-dependent methyltransferase